MTTTTRPAEPVQVERLVTGEELLERGDGGTICELVRGKVVYLRPSAVVPSIVSMNVMAPLATSVRKNALGQCGTAEGGFRLATNPDTVRAPDGWFVSTARLPMGGLPEGYWPGAPDLAVEVLSPSDRLDAVFRKIDDYLNAGVQLVWALDPRGKVVVVCPAGGSPRLVLGGGVLDGEDVVPGFTLPLSEVWI